MQHLQHDYWDIASVILLMCEKKWLKINETSVTRWCRQVVSMWSWGHTWVHHRLPTFGYLDDVHHAKLHWLLLANSLLSSVTKDTQTAISQNIFDTAGNYRPVEVSADLRLISEHVNGHFDKEPFSFTPAECISMWLFHGAQHKVRSSESSVADRARGQCMLCLAALQLNLIHLEQ